jgi:hypothetical protein
MTDRPAGWRVPNPKQIEKLAAHSSTASLCARPLAPNDELPPEYWLALLNDPRADGTHSDAGVRHCRLSQMQQHLLRVSCRRCARIVEIQKIDAVRLFGEAAIWGDVGRRLLDDTCTQRTGRYEEDGCWPSFDTP